MVLTQVLYTAVHGARPGLGPALNPEQSSLALKRPSSVHSLEVGLGPSEGAVHPDGRLTTTRSPARDARAREVLG